MMIHNLIYCTSSSNGFVVGDVLSDLEMFQIYTTIISAGFDIELATEEEWDMFLSQLGVCNTTQFYEYSC